MFFVRAALIDESEPSAYLDKRGDLARALYELQADPRNNYQNYDRALRSNGKPTFIRFGKRSFLGEYPTQQDKL
uniref:Uncharacterized protein n=1 Tax=Acrobeloides nanus TaxID=290746 RepID=A0A914EKH8_9BILA